MLYGFNVIKDKEIDYDMPDIVKTTFTKDGNLLKIKMSHSNKETIHNCLENIAININATKKLLQASS